MQILTNVKDILQMARDERCSGYTAELLVQDLNELIALREAGEKMARMLKYANDMNKDIEDDIDYDGCLWAQNSDTGKKILAALKAWEAANKKMGKRPPTMIGG